MLLPYVQAQQYAATRQFAREHLASSLCPAMHRYFERFGCYPGNLDAPAFQELLDPGDLAVDSSGAKTIEEAYKRYGANIWLQVTPGTPGDETTWNFQLCVGFYYLLRNINVISQHDYTYCVDKTCIVKEFRGGVAVQSQRVPGPALSQAARASVQIFDAHSGGYGDTGHSLVSQVRAYTSRPGITGWVFAHLDLNHDGVVTVAELDANPITRAFSQYYHTDGPFGQQIDAHIGIRLADLSGDRAYLFSYDGLRQLSELYAQHVGVGEALSAQLDAAEDAEYCGNLETKAMHLKMFRHEVRLQTDKALSATDAHVLEVLSRTL